MTDGAGTDEPERGRPVHLDDERALDALVADHDRALVGFFTNGCGKGASMEPVLCIAARATDAAVGLCTPRDDPPLIERFAITSVPTLVLFGRARRSDGSKTGSSPRRTWSRSSSTRSGIRGAERTHGDGVVTG